MNFKPIVFFLFCILFFAHSSWAEDLERVCQQSGWTIQSVEIDGVQRQFLWKGPLGAWTSGTIMVLHGGGGEAAHFCAGGFLVQPQIEFAQMAIRNGFGVVLLDSTTDLVRDQEGRSCGKRFDFSVLERDNLDLPYIEAVIRRVIPAVRPRRSGGNIFMTGLSTGGFMTIRAASHFNELITAFAPISAGDPYGTDSVCDPALSPRNSAKGILIDRETGQDIVNVGSCLSEHYPNESAWPEMKKRTDFKQFHHQQDGIVDFSCFEKANKQLVLHGYSDNGAFLMTSSGGRNVVNHLWLRQYNRPLVEFFKSFRVDPRLEGIHGRE